MSVPTPEVEHTGLSASGDDPDRSARLRRSTLISIAAHGLLVLLLYEQRLEYRAAPLEKREPPTLDQPDIEPRPARYSLQRTSAAPVRDGMLGRYAIEPPIAAMEALARQSRTPPPADPPPAWAADEDALPEQRPHLPPLRRPQDVLARAAATLSRPGRRSPAAALPVDATIPPEMPPTAAVEPPVRGAAPFPTAHSVPPELRRAAAPQIDANLVIATPELPAERANQDLPRQRPADPLTTIALDPSRARSRRRVAAAPLPEMPSESERFAERTTTHATRRVDRPTTHPERNADSLVPDATATTAERRARRSIDAAVRGLDRSVTAVPAGPPLDAGAPDSQISGRLARRTLARRRSADADFGLRSGGGVDRPVRSRGPSPAAPVLASLPENAAGPQLEPRPDEFAPPPAVIVDSPVADGGPAGVPDENAGAEERLASRDSRLIHVAPPVQTNRRVGGKASDRTAKRRSAPAYARRFLNRLPGADSGQKSSMPTEATIALGLEFLAGVQLEDGRWEFQYLGEPAPPEEAGRVIVHADAAATGLALLSFLGAGYDHWDGRYQHHVQRGLNYLVRIQAPSGELYPERDESAGQVARFYGHGIAALALCEAYGMTGDPELRQPAQSALDYLIASQHPELGGWRYVPGTNADLSVSGWQFLALRGGDLAGLSVPATAYDRVRLLLERCREPSGQRARFRYNPWASPSDPRTRHGLTPSTVMTSVGTLMQLLLDGNPRDERLRQGADHLLANLPQLGGPRDVAPTGTLGNPQRDSYYWYYATQVMFQLGDPYWRRWNERLRPLLVTSQIPSGPLAGSWDPYRPVPDKWADYGGRLYVTSLNLLSLEVASRHLPLTPLVNGGPPRLADRPE